MAAWFRKSWLDPACRLAGSQNLHHHEHCIPAAQKQPGCSLELNAMNPMRLFLLSLMTFTTVGSFAAENSDESQPTSRTVQQLEGWTLRVDDRLLGDAPDAALGQRALKFLEAKLVEIKAVVPPGKVALLQKVTIVLDLQCGKLGSMQYHPGAEWLKDNGYPEDLVRCVHLPKAADVVTKRNINEQPWVILHELAHAYHDQQLGFDHPEIKAAQEAYKASGRGDATLLYNGKKVKHYALTNQMEFFAEMTEAYFGSNDFYPFNRAELMESEPEIYQLLHEIWSENGR